MTDRPRPRRRQWQSRAGWLLIVCGLSLVGYAVWQLYGTNLVSERKHGEITASLEHRWESGANLASIDDGAARADALIRIPRFGDDFVVPVLQGTSDDVLSSGIGHFTGSAAAGQAGNYALAGHRVTHGEPLRNMPDLEPGDKIIVETRTRTHTYVLDTPGDGLVIPFSGTWVLDPLPTNPDGGIEPSQQPGQKLLTLTTCSELFHTDERMIAFGHLESTAKK